LYKDLGFSLEIELALDKECMQLPGLGCSSTFYRQSMISTILKQTSSWTLQGLNETFSNVTDCLLQEHKVMASLSKHISDISQQKLAKVDVGIGHMRICPKNMVFLIMDTHQVVFQVSSYKCILPHTGSANIYIELLGYYHIKVQLD